MKGSNEVIGGGGFHHVAIRVVDFDAAVKFYTQGLGFKEKLGWGEGNKRAIMLDTGDGNYVEVFAGGKPETKSEGVMVHFAIRTDNCDNALKRAVDAGAEVTMQPQDMQLPTRPGPTPVRIAFCRAPGGEIIEFFQNEST